MQKADDASPPFTVSIHVNATIEELDVVFKTGLREAVIVELYSLVGEKKKTVLAEDRRAEGVSMDLRSIASGRYIIIVRHGRDLVVKPVQIDRGA